MVLDTPTDELKMVPDTLVEGGLEMVLDTLTERSIDGS